MSVLCVVLFVSSVIPEDDEEATDLEGLLLVALPWFIDSLISLNDDGEGDGLDVEYGFFFFFFCIGIIASSFVSGTSCCGVVIVFGSVTSVGIVVVSVSSEEDPASLCRNRTSVMPIRRTRPARSALMNDHRNSKNRMLMLLLK